MRLKRWMLAVAAIVAIASFPAHSYKTPNEGNLVDSGSFGIFMQGRRVGTETFSVHQRPDVSVISAQLKVENGTDKANQSSELQVAPNGDLRHYEWREHGPEKAQATVDYKDQFLVEYVTTGPSAKPVERAFMLPPSTVILDDFFTHRQILLWRYVASFCGARINPQGCRLEPGKFGVFIPRQQASAIVSVSYNGKEKLVLHGEQRELDRFTLENDDSVWSLWLESAYPFRLMRILVPSENVEVVRD